LTDTYVHALAITPRTPSALYAGTNSGGVFDIELAPTCVGGCKNNGRVTVDEVLTLVNIALGTAEPAACSDGGLPTGG
jgi:hypothetical protein